MNSFDKVMLALVGLFSLVSVMVPIAVVSLIIWAVLHITGH
jgi:hypothetical protein